MAKTKWTEDCFRKALREERNRRELTLEELADVLKANGLDVHWTTLGKIENGTRSVRIDEAARIADVFETSVDAMLGRAAAADPIDAVTRELQRFVYAANTARNELSPIRTSLTKAAFNMRMAANWQPQQGAFDLVNACTEAVELLGQVGEKLAEALTGAETDLLKALEAAERDRGE